MRYILVILSIVFLLGIDRGHHYYTGEVNYIDSEKVIVDNKEYSFTKGMRVLKRYKSGRAFYEDEIKLKSIKSGDKVTLKLVARDVIEMVREDY